MTHPIVPNSFPAVLHQLETLLTEERTALERLDRDRIEAIAEQKLALDAALRASAADTPPEPEALSALRRVRAMALANQLLLVHARSCVKGVLALLSREQIPQRPGLEASAAPPPVAINFRG